MRCKHCGKELKYDINNDYLIYNGDIYCNVSCIYFEYCNKNCILFEIDCDSVDVSSFNKEDWDSSTNWNDGNENDMSIKDAMKILIQHNKWRRDNHIPNKYDMVNPTELGKAIEVAINVMKELIDDK